MWLPTFTAIKPEIARSFYTKAARFVSAFNVKYKNSFGVQFSGLWINLADGSEDLLAVQQAVQIAKSSGITLGAVLAVGLDIHPAPYFEEDFNNFNKLNMMYSCAFTQMAFDVEDILPSGQQNALGVAAWLQRNAVNIPNTVSLVAFSGGGGVTTEKLYTAIGSATKYPFQIIGMVELYSTGSTACLPAGSGCQFPTTVQAVESNWTTGACYKDVDNMAIKQALQNQNGTWAGLSVEGQGCGGGCLIQSVDAAKSCDAHGTLSFAQFTLDQFVQILQYFANWSGSTVAEPLAIMLYESAFVPGPWLASLGIN